MRSSQKARTARAVPTDPEAQEIIWLAPGGKELARITLTPRQHRRLLLFAEVNRRRSRAGVLRLAIDYMIEEEVDLRIPPAVTAEDNAARAAKIGAWRPWPGRTSATSA